MFESRSQAGRALARLLLDLQGAPDLVVLGLPRGGVPVAYEVADLLGAPLDVIVVRKLGVPFQPELAMGALGEGGVRVLDEVVLARTGVRPAAVEEVAARESSALTARLAGLRAGRARPDLRDRIAVIVDDGIATGSTARAACRVARASGARQVLLAVPVAAAETCAGFTDADRLVCVATPRPFGAVGRHYRRFSPTTDDEVARLLARAARRFDGA